MDGARNPELWREIYCARRTLGGFAYSLLNSPEADTLGASRSEKKGGANAPPFLSLCVPGLFVSPANEFRILKAAILLDLV